MVYFTLIMELLIKLAPLALTIVQVIIERAERKRKLEEKYVLDQAEWEKVLSAAMSKMKLNIVKDSADAGEIDDQLDKKP